jgi:hypothetical protein
MAFPVPKDVRAVRDFELVMGMDELIRHGYDLADASVSVDVGEWMKLTTSGGKTKAAKLVTDDDIDEPALAAKVSWTRYRPGDAIAGQSDALATKQVDLLSGTYEAKTKLYVTATTYSPGMLLVAVWDAVNSRGILNGVTVATATVRQLQGAVGKVIEVASGVLHYEAPGL